MKKKTTHKNDWWTDMAKSYADSIVTMHFILKDISIYQEALDFLKKHDGHPCAEGVTICKKTESITMDQNKVIVFDLQLVVMDGPIQKHTAFMQFIGAMIDDGHLQDMTVDPVKPDYGFSLTNSPNEPSWTLLPLKKEPAAKPPAVIKEQELVTRKVKVRE